MATTIDFVAKTVDSADLLSQAAQAGFWREGAPAKINSDSQWEVWQQHLASRKSPKSLGELCKSGDSPLLWASDPSFLRDDTLQLLSVLNNLDAKSKSKSERKKAIELLSDWHTESDAMPASVDLAFQCLAVAHLLPQTASELDPQRWWQLLDELLQLTISATDWPIDSELPPKQALVQQLLVGELPLTLAFLFPEIKACYKLRQSGCEAVSEGLLELTNGQGMMRGPYLDFYRVFLATWTRSATLCQQLKKCSITPDAQEQFDWTVTQSLRLSTEDGRSLLSTAPQETWSPEFLSHTLKTGGDRADVSAAFDVFGKRILKRIDIKPNNRYPETSDHCEWASVATMRSEWEKGAPVIAVDFSSPDLRLEIAAGPESIFRGVWSWETQVDGRSLEPVGCWDEVCWFSDEDVDYIELSIDLSNGGSLDRQILLARDEQFLLLADYVMKTSGGEIRHSQRLPLCDSVSLATEAETREGLLVSDRTVGRVLPLALPEWRTDPRHGELAMIDGAVQLVQQRSGSNLACPLLIDLDRQRARKQCTWRQLTVAQSLEIQPHDVAVGYRAQCGNDQWMVYRSLAEAANRSLLGQNISCECVVARFLSPSGEIEELLEIEAQ